MAINKVIYGDDTLIDLTQDTVAPNKVLLGATFHGANGNSATGTLVTRTVKDTTTADYEDDLDEAEDGDLLIITDSDGALGTNVVNTTEEDFDDAVDEASEGDFIVKQDADDGKLGTSVIDTTVEDLEEALEEAEEGDFLVTVDENNVEDIEDRLTDIETNIGDTTELPNPLVSVCENIAEVNDNLVAENGQTFRYGYVDGKDGRWIKEADTDVFVPFIKWTDITNECVPYSQRCTVDKFEKYTDYNYCYVRGQFTMNTTLSSEVWTLFSLSTLPSPISPNLSTNNAKLSCIQTDNKNVFDFFIRNNSIDFALRGGNINKTYEFYGIYAI